MVFDRHPDRPRPDDVVKLIADNSIGAGPDDSFIVVEDLPYSPDHVVLNLPVGRPGHEDWAAAIESREVATLTKLGPAGHPHVGDGHRPGAGA
ncbi:DUF6211 family protein [Streptomyces mexicanus]|jgi:hypothetical protein|uniref:DUF6211 family protein n=1 Tax=Streptomyces mexicanus TaxID=178566 RepID=UPI0031ED3905